MSLSKEQILDAVSGMSVMDIVQLISMMEEKFGVSVSSIPSSAVIPDSTLKEVTEEKIEFDVILSDIGSNKISVIKVVRASLNLGLKEAKDLVESTPVTIKSAITKDEALSLKKVIEESGATVEIK